ncbi:MAG TPA: sigma-70 family RNA polymerase sigma factor [Anaerolineales bacterium]|nr:sigma-70 family RNA polymerase sigma factor [Anaerolineales bacterium]
MKDEAALLKAAKKLDQDALIAIFDRYAPAIYKYIFRWCPDPVEADHIVGGVFAKLLEQFVANQGPPANLRFCVYQIAYSLVVERARQNQRFISLGVVIDTPVKLVTKSTRAAANEQASMDMLVAILKHELSEIERQVIILRFLEDFGLGETAAIVGKNINHVKTIQNRGMAKLRKCLRA